MTLYAHCQTCNKKTPSLKKLHSYICQSCKSCYNLDEQSRVTKLQLWLEGYRVVVDCSTCNTMAYSRYDGEVAPCSCEAVAIKETSNGHRVLGASDYDYRIVYFPELGIKSRQAAK